MMRRCWRPEVLGVGTRGRMENTGIGGWRGGEHGAGTTER